MRTYGARGLRRRLWHEVRRRLGWFSAAPQVMLPARAGVAVPRYRPSAAWGDVGVARREKSIERGERVVAGEYEAFGHAWRSIPQSAREWHTDPNTGFTWPDAPWWTIYHLPAGADVKDIWEPARFSWIYDLVRANAVAQDGKYTATFHEKVAAWLAANPPFRGVHWSCGQEVSIRALALLHGESAFAVLPGQAPGGNVIKLLAYSGERIADAIGYGLSQRNNHGISEAAGLVHIGLRLAGAHPSARRWLEHGRHLLDEQIQDQFSDDGWYAQHSFTYMRVALEQALLAQRALRTAGSSLSRASLGKLASAVSAMIELVDAETGVLPNHGSNDGARIAPFSSAGYRDFRPVITLGALVLGLSLPADVPQDAEVLGWIGGTVPAGAARPGNVVIRTGSWAMARVGEAVVFLRAGSYSHRPSHIDPLHLDIRFRAQEVVTDAGTYAYNAPAPWNNGLVSARVHNGPTIDDTEPAIRGPRFLWYSWPESRIVAAGYADGRATLVAEVPGRVRREVIVTPGAVEVIDRAIDPAASVMEVFWLLHPDLHAEYVVDAPAAQRVPSRDDDVRGWFSASYGKRVPAIGLRVRCQVSDDGCVIRTLFPHPARIAS
jgi:heparinase II/III-like protein